MLVQKLLDSLCEALVARTVGRKDEFTLRSLGTVLLETVQGLGAALGNADGYNLTSISNFAALLKLQGKFAEAEPLYLKAVQGSRAALGNSHPDTLALINNFACWVAQHFFVRTIPDRRLKSYD